MIDAALRWKLQQSSAVTALVGDRIVADVPDYPERASDIARSVYFQMTDYADEDAGVGGASNSRRATFELFCLAQSPDDAIALALAVESAIYFQPGTWLTTQVRGVTLTGGGSEAILTADGKGFARRLTFDFRYSPAS